LYIPVVDKINSLRIETKEFKDGSDPESAVCVDFNESDICSNELLRDRLNNELNEWFESLASQGHRLI